MKKCLLKINIGCKKTHINRCAFIGFEYVKLQYTLIIKELREYFELLKRNVRTINIASVVCLPMYTSYFYYLLTTYSIHIQSAC